MNLELRPHIAQARNPVTDQPLVDSEGQPVPLFPNQRSIFLDGALIGYVCEPPKRGLAFIVRGVPEQVIEETKKLVALEFGEEPARVSTLPEIGASDVE